MRVLKNSYVSMAGWGIFLAGALSLASCSNDDLPSGEEQGPAIEFGEVKTRAEVTEASQVREFGVFAEQNYLLEDGSESSDFISLLDNEKVYRISEDENADFTYDNKRYWVEDREFNFFAIYPYSENATRTTFQKDGRDYEGYAMSFETLTDPKDDMMASYVTYSTSESIPASVDFNYQHLLSKISFFVTKDAENANDAFTVQQITLDNVKRSGTYYYSPQNSGTETWVTTGEGRTHRRTNLGKVITTTGVNIFSDGNNPEYINGMLCIPQVFEDNQIKLTITYQYKQSGEGSQMLAQNKEVYLPAGNWEKGKHIRYNLELAVDNTIYISTPTVESWGTMQSMGTIIIN